MRRSRGGYKPPCDGDQLRLDLFRGVPWDGQSLRGLTKVSNVLYLRREPPGHEVEPDPLQLELWPVAGRARYKKATAQRAGAPLLVEPHRRDAPGRRRRRFDEEDGHGSC